MTADEYAQVNKKLDTITEILTGNGDPQKGVILRLDRVEQSTAAAKWFIGVVIVALVGLFIGQINLIRLDAIPAVRTTDDGR